MPYNSTLYYGKVVRVSKGFSDGPDGEPVPDWLVDIEPPGCGLIEGCRVIGPLAPQLHTEARPSWAVVGFIGGNDLDAVCWPDPKTAESRAKEFAYHEWFLETSRVALHIHESGQFTLRGRGPDGESIEDSESNGNADWRLRIDALGALFEMLGGGNRMARGPTTGEAPTAGDKVSITLESSPLFVAWLAAVAAATSTTALFDLILDPIPDFDGQGAPATSTFQAIGEIVTGSGNITGK